VLAIHNKFQLQRPIVVRSKRWKGGIIFCKTHYNKRSYAEVAPEEALNKRVALSLY